MAAVALTLAVAACGGGSSAPPATTPSAPGPSASASSSGASPAAATGDAIGASLINAPAGNGGSAPVSHQNAPTLKSASSSSLSVGSASVSHAAAGGQITSGGSGAGVVGVAHSVSPAKTGHKTATPSPATPKPPTPKPPAPAPPAPTRTTPTRTASTPAPPPSPPRTVVRTIVKTKVRTVVRTAVKVRTVTKTLRPDVPSTAFLPSRHPALALTSFTVPGSNVGCQIGPGGARCSIQRRVWAAPPQPSRCRSSWGDTIFMPRGGAAGFICGGNSGISPNAKVIPDGWDDTVGKVTCQVRAIGIDCFSKTHHGFMISRTGYAAY